MHADAKLIEKLGNPRAVAGKINARLSEDDHISEQAVSMWKQRGVSVYFRNLFAELLIEAGIRVPKGFTKSRHRGW